jgi:DNA modification methylase
MRRPILNNSARGELVYEPFAGSGTTLIAADTVERICLAMEIDPHYCDVIVERWQRFSGGKAVREGDDRGFDDLKTEHSAA